MAIGIPEIVVALVVLLIVLAIVYLLLQTEGEMLELALELID